MKVYLLWYQNEGWEVPRVVCALRDYYKGEEVAQNLEFCLKHFNGCDTSTIKIGITKTLMNKFHIDPREVESTWVIYDKGSWFLEEE